MSVDTDRYNSLVHAGIPEAAARILADSDQTLLPGGLEGLPDPAEAPDGQVPTTVDGAYALAAVVGPLQVVTRTLTSAEVLALFSEPVELVVGVPDAVYVPLSGFFHHVFGTTPYAFAFGAGVLVGIPGVWNPVQLSGSGLLDTAELAFGSAASGGSNSGLDSALAGQPLSIFWPDADPTDGDGTLDVTVLYREVDVS